jgi:hypothetical protein
LPEFVQDRIFKQLHKQGGEEDYKRISFLLYGPRIPLSYLGKDEIVDKGLDAMKNWLSNKMNSCVQYPQSVFFAMGEKVLEMQLEDAYKFRLLRKVLH